MHQLEITSFARSVLDTHGLQAWEFRIVERLARSADGYAVLAICDHIRKNIRLTRAVSRCESIFAGAAEDFIKGVILHEAAHAIVGPGYGHGGEWATVALSLGVRNPSESVSTAALDISLYPHKKTIKTSNRGLLIPETEL